MMISDKMQLQVLDATILAIETGRMPKEAEAYLLANHLGVLRTRVSNAGMRELSEIDKAIRCMRSRMAPRNDERSRASVALHRIRARLMKEMEKQP